MDNYQAIAYACIALTQLQREGGEITEYRLRGEMLSLMDMYSESEIYEMYCNEKY